MITVDQLLGFGVAALILIAIPGPSVVCVIGRALAHEVQLLLLGLLTFGIGMRAENICWAPVAPPYSDPVTRQLSRVLASHDVAGENGDARLRRTRRTPYDI